MPTSDLLKAADFRILVEAMTDGVVVQNVSGAITCCNASALRILGLTEDEIRGRTSKDPRWCSIHEDGSAFPGSEHPAMQALRTRIPQRDVVMGVRKPDGFLTWISIDAHPLLGTDGGFSGVVTTFHDLTERRNAETLLRSSLAELTDLYTNAPCGYHSLDRDGVFVRINDTELHWLGYAREELIGRKRAIDLLTPRSVEHFTATFPQLLRVGSIKDVELELVTRDGRTLNVLVNATVLRDPNEDLVLSRWTVYDNTQRKLAQDQMRRLNQLLEARVEERTAALHEAMQELEAFTSSVSHDLRAPIRAIDGFAHALRDDPQIQFSNDAQLMLDRLIAANRREAQIIDDLLNLSRVFSSTLSLEHVDLTALAGAVLEDLQHLDTARRVDVRITPGLIAWADAGLMRSVMENLLSNAWKFTSKTAHPTIEVGSLTQDDVTVYFVRDNGAGFDAAHAQDLFKPFHRMHTQMQFPGTGVGLATVDRIIKRHRGRIWIDSARGRGATVYFTLAKPA